MASARLSKPLNIIEEDSKYCTPCKTKNKKVESQYYCTDCEAYYCEDCFELHPRVPYLAKHIVLKHDDIAVWSKLQYKCTTHDKKLEFFCGEHKMLCCHVCVSLKHRSCANMEYILESAKNICAKDEIRMMLQRTQTELETIDLYEGKFEVKTGKNLQSKSEYLQKLEEHMKKIKELIDLLKKKAIVEMTEKFEANKRYSDEMEKKLKKFKMELQDLKQQLKTATEEKEVLIFISLKRGEHIMEDVKRELSEMDASTNKDIFNPKFDSQIEGCIRSVENIASVEDEQMRQESVYSEDYDNVMKENSKKQNKESSVAICEVVKDSDIIYKHGIESNIFEKTKPNFSLALEKDDENYESKYSKKESYVDILKKSSLWPQKAKKGDEENDSKKESCMEREDNIMGKTKSVPSYKAENAKENKKHNYIRCGDMEYEIFENPKLHYKPQTTEKVKEGNYPKKESCVDKEYSNMEEKDSKFFFESKKEKKLKGTGTHYAYKYSKK